MNQPLKVFLNGSQGRLNQTLIAYAREHAIEICTGGVNPRENPEPGLAAADVAIDFSFHAATLPLVQTCYRLQKPIVIATTGHTAAEKQMIEPYAEKIPMMWSGNYAVGVNVFFYAVRKAAEKLDASFHAEIIEAHHAKKKDSPGGTATRLIDILTHARSYPEDVAVQHGRYGIVGPRRVEEIGVHAVRAGDIVGEHTVVLAGEGERLEIIQRSHHRHTFAHGAFMAANWLLQQPAGRLYRMEDVLGLTD